MFDRTVLFRGKCLKTNAWVYGHYIQDKDGNHIICEYANWRTFTFSIYYVHLDSLGQLTGVLDSFGNDIFEGDFVRNIQAEVNLVHWYFGGWHYQNYHAQSISLTSGENPYRDDSKTSHQIIGNKFDNPEMMDKL